MKIPEPGPERDELIAKHVMNAEPLVAYLDFEHYVPYSTDLSFAWDVLDEIRSWVGIEKDDLHGENLVNKFFYHMLQGEAWRMHTMTREEVADLITRSALLMIFDKRGGQDENTD